MTKNGRSRGDAIGGEEAQWVRAWHLSGQPQIGLSLYNKQKEIANRLATEMLSPFCCSFNMVGKFLINQQIYSVIIAKLIDIGFVKCYNRG